ncbi:excalibur calcium-binding domain-containing protein [Nocardioides sp.]|uniref:excalibur calcium-binding domain-containing protein n=1 Tax=Nocardioides sp. TaxID=35761 RepID=UPI0035649E37
MLRKNLASALTLMFALVMFVSLASASPAQAKDKNCSDFNSQAAAQQYFESNGGGPNNNVDGLDADGDGEACESNPCPCSGYSGGGGGGNNGGTKPKSHNLTAKLVRGGTAKVVGKVTTFKNHKVRVLRKVGAGPYKGYKSVKTGPKTGAFKTVVKKAGKKRTCFSVVVPGTKKYRKTTKNIGCIN